MENAVVGHGVGYGGLCVLYSGCLWVVKPKFRSGCVSLYLVMLGAGCWVFTFVLVCLVCVPFPQDCTSLVAFGKTSGGSKLL